MSLKKLSSIIVAAIPCVVSANQTPRVGQMSVSVKDIQKVFVAEGRSAVIKFPCNIKTYSPGPTNDIEAKLNTRDSQLLEIWLGKQNAQPSGLKVFCNNAFFMFDIVPSRTQHQDFLEIKRSYGVPTMISNLTPMRAVRVIASSDSKSKTEKKSYKTIKILSSSQAVSNEQK